MIRRILRAVVWMLATAYGVADTYVRQPSVDAIRYEIAIELTEGSDAITGVTKAQFQIRSEASGMWLDFDDMSIDQLSVGGVPRPFTYQGGRVVFEFERVYFANEIVQIEVRYHGKPKKGLLIGKNRYGGRVVFADNWPSNAHHWFPSIDHPSDKATVSFALTAPAKYEVVANGRKLRTASLADGRKIHQWSESKPIPTYCMAFGLAEFSVAPQKETAGVPLAWYAYPQDAEAASRKFSRTALMVSYFRRMIGPYPYEKLAQVESTIGMGGMENSSAIFYSEFSFRGDPVSEEPVAHEIAHQWFGDSVTESDWDHLWLSEGFATYFEDLFYEHLKGPGELKRRMERHAKIIAQYAPALFAPVVDPGETDPLRKLNPLNYEKGAWILHMLRGVLGDEVFFRGIRKFYGQYEGKNASSDDFRKAMESASGIGLSSFFQQWLYRPGWPQYRVSHDWNESARELQISIRQVQTTGLFDMPIDIAVSAGRQTSIYRFRVNDAIHTFRIPLRTKPSSVVIDPGEWVLKSVSISK